MLIDKKDLNLLDTNIRRVPDFPKPGILFYDITSLLINPEAFSLSLDLMASMVIKSKAEVITAIEARGFIFAAPLAMKLNLPLVLIRKPGKLPNPSVKTNFNLEYGSDTICIQKIDLLEKRRFLLSMIWWQPVELYKPPLV